MSATQGNGKSRNFCFRVTRSAELFRYIILYYLYKLWRTLGNSQSPSEIRIRGEQFQLRGCFEKSGTPPENGALLLKLLDGEIPDDDPILDFVLLNAATLLVCAEKAVDWKDGVSLARESIKSGQARKALDGFIKGSTEVADSRSRMRGVS